MLRSFLIQLANRTKAEGAIDRLLRKNPVLRSPILRALDLREHHGQEAFGVYEAFLLTRLLRAAQKTPYGQNRSLDLTQWPVLEKADIVRNSRRFLFPRNPLRIPAGTGGTSGVPIELWRSLESVVAEQTFIDHMLAPYHCSMHGSKVAVLRADSIKQPDDLTPPFGRFTHGGNRLVLSSPHLNRRTVGWYHDALKKFAPAVLWVYPSSVVSLLTLLARAGLTLNIPIILASSETLSGQMHQLIEQTFSGKVINYYGQAERVCMAYSTEPNVFHFNPCYGKVELLPHDEEAEGGQRAMKIIGTSYWNRVMPLVRYNTGDLLYVPEGFSSHELREIEEGKRAFTSIAGRDGEFILTREGTRIIGLNHIPREVQHVSQIQLVQHDYDRLDLDVLALPGFSDEDAKQLIDQARAKMPSGMQIELHQVDRLHTTARGKTPFVVRILPVA